MLPKIMQYGKNVVLGPGPEHLVSTRLQAKWLHVHKTCFYTFLQSLYKNGQGEKKGRGALYCKNIVGISAGHLVIPSTSIHSTTILFLWAMGRREEKGVMYSAAVPDLDP